MSERNEDELNDKEQQTSNEDIEREIEETVELNSVQDKDTYLDNEQADAAAPAEAPHEAPTKNNSAVAVPWIIAVIAVAALVFVLFKYQSSDKGLNETVAEMDGIKIKQSDVYTEITTKQMSEDQLISLVNNVAQTKIVDLESDKAGIKITDEDVKKELETLKKQYGFATDDDLNAALQQSGITLEDFKDKQIKPDLKIKLLFENHNPVTDDALKAYFDKNKDTFATTPKEVRASHILLPTKEEADAVLAELKAGKDFATLAKEKSQDGSKDKGGDLGFFGTGKMDADFEAAAFALAKGEMSDVVQSQFGYHIIKVTDVKEAVVPEFDTVKADVKEAYYNEKLQTEGLAWVESLKKARNYKNLLEKKPEPAASASPEASPTAAPSATASSVQ
ncbi:peptidylprolyl isomerase [Cohnella mopanensis]|uniref:peptidylprolyl isomerase n=1 Tax=Cohnella mopanensis TaxID=2911966 RepID=UPI001EF84F2A|nr:peptidylprolyl isomerase [Cohnella mopanensis]